MQILWVDDIIPRWIPGEESVLRIASDRLDRSEEEYGRAIHVGAEGYPVEVLHKATVALFSLPQCLLRALAIADVDVSTSDPSELTIDEDRSGREDDVPGRAILMKTDGLSGGNGVPAQHLAGDGTRVFERVAVGAGKQSVEVPPKGLFARVPKELLRALVPLQNVLLDIERDDGVRGTA